jgi:hypothetical protein
MFQIIVIFLNEIFVMYVFFFNGKPFLRNDEMQLEVDESER